MTIQDMITGIEHRDALLVDYRCRYTTTQRGLYRPVYDEVDPAALGPRVLRFEKPTAEEAAQLAFMRHTYRFCAKGAKFAFEVDVELPRERVGDVQRHRTEKRAFDGTRLLTFSESGDEKRGSIKRPGHHLPQAPNFVPDEFFSRCERTRIADWLVKEPVKIHPAAETALGRECHVVDCKVKNGIPAVTFYICPELGFMPLKTILPLNRPTGEYGVIEVKKVVEVSAGIWFPVKAVKEWYERNPEDPRSLLKTNVLDFEIDVSSLEVNSGGVSDDEFTFAFPPGTEVFDEFTQTRSIAGISDRSL